MLVHHLPGHSLKFGNSVSSASLHREKLFVFACHAEHGFPSVDRRMGTQSKKCLPSVGDSCMFRPSARKLAYSE